MPGRLKVKIISGRHLPVMDRASDLTDAFVEIKFGSHSYKTDVCSKSLNPIWNSDWFKFEVDDEELQDEPLQIRVLDHDTYSSHDAIGKVYIDVDPLMAAGTDHYMSGWFPIYDTMHGIRGEILVVIRMDLFLDSNQYKQSCCGFSLLYASTLPDCFELKKVHGLVSGLLARDDPEYQWIDRMRSPRASNEARQRLFTKMSGELQRKIGSKAQKLGGNAVIGYQQVLDIEGDSGVVIRGIGTVVSISSKGHQATNRPQMLKQFSTPSPSKHEKLSKYESSYTSLSSLGGFNASFTSTEFGHSEINHLKEELLFSTMKQHAAGFVQRYSSTVCTRSVKILPSPDDADTRNTWWNDLRQEITDHCSSIGCNAVLGYTETTSVCDDVILMSAQGTAAMVDKDFQQYDIYDDCNVFQCDQNQSQDNRNFSRSIEQEVDDAKLFQIPIYLLNCVPSSAPQPSPLNPDCLVPDIVLATVDLPPNLQTVGRCCLIQARFCRTKKKNSGETCAVNITEMLPFIEYELHRQLYCKLKLRGLNAIFGLKSSISIGENLLIGIATGTGVKLAALPSSQPSDLKTAVFSTCNLTHQNNLEEFSSLCKKRLKTGIRTKSMIKKILKESTPLQKTNLVAKSLAAASLDDDGDVVMLLEDHLPDEKITLTTLESWPTHQSSHLVLSQMFRRIRYDDDCSTSDLNAALRKCCEDLLASLTFRVSKCHNDVINFSSIRFNIVLTDDQFQIWLVGSAFAPQQIQQVLSSSQKETFTSRSINKRVRSVSDEGRTSVRFPAISAGNTLSLIHRLRRSNTIVAMMKRHFSEDFHLDHLKLNNLTSSCLVELIPASDVPNIYRYLGSINLFIIRETTAVRGSEEELPDTEPHPSACNWFVTRAIFEAQTLARAHANAMGGNALIAYSCTSAILKQNFAKNEAQLLMSISGDVVYIDFNQHGAE